MNADLLIEYCIVSSILSPSVAAVSSSDHVFDVGADYVNISGFNVTGTTARTMAGIYLYGANNCNISDNTASNNGRGIYMYGSSNNTLANNTTDSNNNYGIYLRSSCDNDVTCNLVQNNTDCGICLTIGSTGNTIAWNNIVANGELQNDGRYHYQFKNSQSDGVDAINNFWGAGMNNSTIDAR